MTIFLFFVAHFVFPASLASAQTAVNINNDSKPVILGRHLGVFEDKVGDTTIDQVSKGERRTAFTPSEWDAPNFFYTSSVIWLRFTVRNDSDSPLPLYLEDAMPWGSLVELYVPSGTGFDVQRAGVTVPVGERRFPHINPLFRFTLAPRESKELFIQSRGETPMLFPLTLYTEDGFASHDRMLFLFNGLLFGLMTALLVYNGFVFLSTRDKSYLFYVIYVACTISLLMSMHGISYHFFSGSYLWIMRREVIFGAWLFQMTAISFAISFLRTKEVSPRLHAVLTWYRWFGLMILVLVVTTQQIRILSMITVTSSQTYPLLMTAAGFICLRRGVREARFFILAWLGSITGLAVLGLENMGELPYSPLMYQGAFQVGLCVEMLLLSLALADRIKIGQALKEEAENRLRVREMEERDRLEKLVAERTDEIRQAKELAENATKIKDKYISLVSHDLQSPLSSIMVMLGIFEDKERYRLGEEEEARMVTRARQSVGGLIAMIDQLLDLSRLQTGRLSVIKRFLNAREIVTAAMGYYHHSAGLKGITLVNEVPPGMILFVDQALFSEVINNLISNAVKFCVSGNTITIFAPDATSIAVKDNGTGIPPKILLDIFKPEVKTTTIGTDGEKGTGLGLPYCKEIMIAHGGDLTVISTQGEGTAFTLRVPASRPIVLVVDDQDAQRSIIKMHLFKMQDVEILEAGNGEEAMIALARVTPTVVITDIHMPVMDGFELLKKIRAVPEFYTLPVIVTTSGAIHDGIEDIINLRKRALEEGATDFVMKPIVVEDFIPRIQRFF